jgi:hypothetical protein
MLKQGQTDKTGTTSNANGHVSTNGFRNSVKTFLDTYDKGDRFGTAFSCLNGGAGQEPVEKETVSHSPFAYNKLALQLANKQVRDTVQSLAKEFNQYKGTIKFKINSVQVTYDRAINRSTFWKMLPVVFPWLAGAAIGRIGESSSIWKSFVAYMQDVVPKIKIFAVRLFENASSEVIKEWTMILGGGALALAAWLIARSPIKRAERLEKNRSKTIEGLDAVERSLKETYLRLSELYCRYIAKQNGFAYEGQTELEGDERAAARQLIADIESKYRSTIKNLMIYDPFANINEWLAEQTKPKSRLGQFADGMKGAFSGVEGAFAALSRKKDASASQ